MIFLLHSETETGSIARNLGAPEYSYYFVLREFRPILEEFGMVVPINDPAHEVDRIWRNARNQGESCLFLSFSPPHRTSLAEHCPTIPIFAWEFDTLPTECWDSDSRNDWRTLLRAAGRAITHSQFAVRTSKTALGEAYPIISLPAPVWDRFAPLYRRNRSITKDIDGQIQISVRGRVIDSRLVDFSRQSPIWRRAHGIPNLPDDIGERSSDHLLSLGGVIYTSVFCPVDGRKNWFDMICGFCWAFRDTDDATLVLKLTHRDCGTLIQAMLGDLAKLAPFRCRVLIIDGYLPDNSYQDLTAVSAYTVNSSHGEGQCLPLMEYMSAGKPAVAPDHTAMADYIDDANSFVVASHPEPARWPHDPRQVYRTRQRRIDFESLLQAYRDSYFVAKSDPARYATMAAAAHIRLRDHCSRRVVRRGLADFIAPLISEPLIRTIADGQRDGVRA